MAAPFSEPPTIRHRAATPRQQPHTRREARASRRAPLGRAGRDCHYYRNVETREDELEAEEVLLEECEPPSDFFIGELSELPLPSSLPLLSLPCLRTCMHLLFQPRRRARPDSVPVQKRLLK